MTYITPSLTLLGDARALIEFNSQGSKTGIPGDNAVGSNPQHNSPAYDLDE